MYETPGALIQRTNQGQWQA